MDVPFLQSINGHWKQLKKWTLQKVSSAPVDSVEGGVWYNETSKRIEVDIGSENKEVAYVGESAEHNSLLDKDGGDTINNYYGHVKQIHNNILDNFGKASGAIVSDSNNFIPIEQIPVGLLGGLTPKGAWNPSTNTPSLSNPPLATTRGWFYIASTSGTSLGTDWASGDWCISDGTVWQKIDNTDKVSSVYGRTGSVVAASGDYNLDQINDGTTYKRITSTEKNNYNTAYTHSQTTGNSHSIVASQIPSTATGNVSATNVQAAIAELDSEKLAASTAASTYATIVSLNAHIVDSSGAHAASAISCTATGDVAATNVQAALSELASEKLSTSTAASTYATIASVAAKQNALAFDSVPTDGSTNPVTSNGVYDALLGKSANGHTHDSITSNAGGASIPVYFSSGKPVACTSLNLSTSGNAATATKLANARTIALTGEVTGSGSFDGSDNLSIATTVADNSHLHTTGNVTGLDTALAGKAPLDMGANSWTTITNGATATWVDGFSLTCPIASGVNNYANQTLEVWCVYGESASLQHMTSIHLHLCARGTTVTYRAQAEGSYALGEIYARFDNGGTIAYLTPAIHLPANAKLFVRRARGYGTAGAGFNTTYTTIPAPISYAWAIDRTGDYRVVSRSYVSGQAHNAGTIYLEY